MARDRLQLALTRLVRQMPLLVGPLGGHEAQPFWQDRSRTRRGARDRVGDDRHGVTYGQSSAMRDRSRPGLTEAVCIGPATVNSWTPTYGRSPKRPCCHSPLGTSFAWGPGLTHATIMAGRPSDRCLMIDRGDADSGSRGPPTPCPQAACCHQARLPRYRPTSRPRYGPGTIYRSVIGAYRRACLAASRLRAAA